MDNIKVYQPPGQVSQVEAFIEGLQPQAPGETGLADLPPVPHTARRAEGAPLQALLH